MKSFYKKLMVAGALCAFSTASFAQDKATSLEQLLSMMKSSEVTESKEHKAREAEFIAQKNERSNLLEKAKSSRIAEEKRSTDFEAKYAAQDLEIQAKRKQLDEALGALKELFGHLSSAADDYRSGLGNSLVSVQYPGREKFALDLIEKMNSETKLPTVAEIEKLFYEIQFETVESGKVVKFNATIADANGSAVQREIVRVGNYGAVSQGEYLFFDRGALTVPATQPSGVADAGAAQSATTGLVAASIDPTLPLGGQIMQIMNDRPNLMQRIDQGGLVGYIILIGLGGIGFILGLYKFITLSVVGAKVSSQLKAKNASVNNPLGRVLKVAEENPNVDGESLELKLEEAVLKERPSLDSGLNMIKIISMVAPLMGLLGTVTGMIQTFQAITDFGAGDPKLMAGGISAALVTTVQGLVVAIPTVFLFTILSGKAKRILHILEEQSAGLIAEKSER
ncbi:MAG: MotA/TolQ/ExbB proton channel family protein [Marinagarivorans sp.]|nr:MotA/TolQ/ExbB proton channel family protein [Marinagarivorans sp.]